MTAILTDRLHRLAYATDASAYREVPAGVAYPESPEDVRELVAEARRRQVGEVAVERPHPVARVIELDVLKEYLIGLRLQLNAVDLRDREPCRRAHRAGADAGAEFEHLRLVCVALPDKTRGKPGQQHARSSELEDAVVLIKSESCSSQVIDLEIIHHPIISRQ